MGIKVFWLEPTTLDRVWLRRYKQSNEGAGCPLNGYHNEWLLMHDRWNEDEPIERPAHDDPRWPTRCACGYEFQEDDEWQVFRQGLYTGAPDGQMYTLREAPVGAMWNANWYDREVGDPHVGPDGIALCVKTPGGEWAVDSECSNCPRTQWGKKTVDGLEGTYWLGRTHYCWCRHGDPRTGNVHVDKTPHPGTETCTAGAGSIISGGWHGYLHNGELSPC